MDAPIFFLHRINLCGIRTLLNCAPPQGFISGQGCDRKRCEVGKVPAGWHRGRIYRLRSNSCVVGDLGRPHQCTSTSHFARPLPENGTLVEVRYLPSAPALAYIGSSKHMWAAPLALDRRTWTTLQAINSLCTYYIIIDRSFVRKC